RPLSAVVLESDLSLRRLDERPSGPAADYERELHALSRRRRRAASGRGTLSTPRHAALRWARRGRRAALLLSRLEVRGRRALLGPGGRRVAVLRPVVDPHLAGARASWAGVRVPGRGQAAGISALSRVRALRRPARDRFLPAALQLFSEYRQRARHEPCRL